MAAVEQQQITIQTDFVKELLIDTSSSSKHYPGSKVTLSSDKLIADSLLISRGKFKDGHPVDSANDLTFEQADCTAFLAWIFFFEMFLTQRKYADKISEVQEDSLMKEVFAQVMLI
jgi:hypothetical protein